MIFKNPQFVTSVDIATVFVLLCSKVLVKGVIGERLQAVIYALSESFCGFQAVCKSADVEFSIGAICEGIKIFNRIMLMHLCNGCLEADSFLWG